MLVTVSPTQLDRDDSAPVCLPSPEVSLTLIVESVPWVALPVLAVPSPDSSTTLLVVWLSVVLSVVALFICSILTGSAVKPPSTNFRTLPPCAYALAIPPWAKTFLASISLPCFGLPVRVSRTLDIISFSTLAPALELPLPRWLTTSAGITNSPSLKAAGCTPSMLEGTSSAMPSVIPFR